MRGAVFIGALLLLVGSTGFGGPARATSVATIDVIVPASSRVTSMTAHELEAIFTRAQTRWDNGAPIIPFNFPPGDGLRDQFDRAVLRLTPDQVGRFWLERRIRGFGMPPKQVNDASLMVKVIERLPGSIGYVPSDRIASARVRVVARISQGRVIGP